MLHKFKAAWKAFKNPRLLWEGELALDVLYKHCSGNEFIIMRSRHISKYEWAEYVVLTYRQRQMIRRILDEF